MLLKTLLILIASAFLTSVLLPADTNLPVEDPPSYVKLEVRGTLIHQKAISFIQAYDSSFPDVRLVVKLERSEDKNQELDRHLEGLHGKPVVANGFLDCRRVGQEAGVIYMYLTSESQVQRQKKDEGK
jgi:hypothetical protein